MNLHELNAIANNAPALRYCVERHNAAIGILREVYGFVEKNLDIFDSPSVVWDRNSRNRQYHENHSIGTANPYNCVLRDFHYESAWKDGCRIYWVDGGIIFRVAPDGKRVGFLTDCGPEKYHGYKPDGQYWNDSGDFTDFNFCIGRNAGVRPKYDRNFVPDWEKELWSEERFHDEHHDEFSAAKLKKAVDEDYAHAERVLERLALALRKINESIMARLSKLNETLGGSSTKVTEYTIAITKTER